jgi:hypothetical protein
LEHKSKLYSIAGKIAALVLAKLKFGCIIISSEMINLANLETGVAKAWYWLFKKWHKQSMDMSE